MGKYPNPITSPGNIRDPFILRVGDVYYLTGSQAPFWQDHCQGIKLFRSMDLIHWIFVSDILRRADIPEDAWYIDRLWAPEILHRPEGFYLTFNGRNENARYRHNLGSAIAFSENIEGPYRVLTQDRPLLATVCYPLGERTDINRFDTNDASLYADETGTYLYYCNPFGIWGVRIELPTCRFIGEAFCCIRPSKPGCWDTKIEGPYLTRQNGRYYQFYSSFTQGYSIGVVTADDPCGPWSPNPHKPVLSPAPGVTHAGHNAVFTTTDGTPCICYHVQREKDPTEYLCIDEVRFYPEGRVCAVGSKLLL